MNNIRRKKIDKAIATITQAQMMIEDIKSEEEEYVDNAPENLVDSERYTRASEICDELDDAIGLCDELTELLDGAKY